MSDAAWGKQSGDVRCGVTHCGKCPKAPYQDLINLIPFLCNTTQKNNVEVFMSNILPHSKKQVISF